MGVDIIVVGIGKDINKEELDHMAGGDGKAYLAKDFDTLIGNLFITKIATKACDLIIAGKIFFS